MGCVAIQTKRMDRSKELQVQRNLWPANNIHRAQVKYVSQQQEHLLLHGQSQNDIKQAQTQRQGSSRDQQKNQKTRLQQTSHRETQESSNLRKSTLQVMLSTVDRRKAGEKLKFPNNCIGVLTFFSENEEDQQKYAKQFRGSGFLISPNLVVTSAHFIEAFKKYGSEDMKFLISSYSNDSFENVCFQSRAAYLIGVSQKFELGKSKLSEDYALVYIDSKVQRDKYITLGANFCQSEVEANIYGFPLEDSSKKFNLVGMSGLIKSINNNSIQYDIDTTMGQSGSPIMIEYASHEHIAIGIHTGKDDADAYNSGCLITNQTINQIKLWIREYANSDKNDDTISTDKTIHYLYGKRINLEAQQFNYVNLEGGGIKLYSELIKLKCHSEIQNSQDHNGVYTSSEYIQLSKNDYSEQKYHNSLVAAERGLRLEEITENERSQLYSLIGMNYMQLEQYELALYYFSQCLNSQLVINGKDKKNYMKCLNNIGRTYLQLNQVGKAKIYFNLSKKISKKKEMKRDKNCLAELVNEGSVCLSEGDFLKSYSLFQSARKLSFELSEFIDHDKALILQHLAIACFNLAKYNEWLENSFGNLWILGQLKLKNQSQFDTQKDAFLKQINIVFNRCDRGLQLKIGRVFKMLKISSEESPAISEKISRLLIQVQSAK